MCTLVGVGKQLKSCAVAQEAKAVTYSIIASAVPCELVALADSVILDYLASKRIPSGELVVVSPDVGGVSRLVIACHHF